MTCRSASISKYATLLLASVALSCSAGSQNSHDREQQEQIARVQAIMESTKVTRERMHRHFDEENGRLAALSDAELCGELISKLRGGSWLLSRGRWGSLLEVEAKKRGNAHLQKYLQSVPADALANISDDQFLLMIFSMGAREDPPSRQLEENIESLVLQTMSRGGRPLHHLAAMWPHVVIPRLNDGRLTEELRACHSGEQFENAPHYQMVLTEIIGRGGGEFQSALAEDERRRNGFELDKEAVDFRTFAAHTALCRLQHKADPIEVIIEDGKQLECTFPDMPPLSLAIVNRDEQRAPVGIHLRDGQPEGWWLEVWDSSGNRMPVGEPVYFPATISHPGYDVLKFGERRQEQRMLLCDRVQMLPPGQYKVIAYFSGEGEIGRDQSLEELICSHSQPLTLTVKPIVLHEDTNVRQHVRDLVARLPEGGPIKVVGGTYGSWAYQLVPPFSAQEQILRMGPRALPELLDMLDDESLSPRRRAWVLSLLYSLTGLNDPTRRFEDKTVLGGFESVGYYWNIFGNGYRPCKFGGVHSPDADPIDAQAQRRFAEQWKPVRQYVQVRK